MAMSPWKPERDPVILRRMGKTGEEAAELLKVTNRVVIQGIDGIDPASGKSNRQMLLEETADLMAQCRINIAYFGLDEAAIQARIATKTAQMYEWEELVKE